MRAYTIGVEDHYAWVNLVCVSMSGADVHLLDKRRVELLDAALPSSPYHGETQRMPLATAESLVQRVIASANARAEAALASLLADCAPAACRGLAIRVPPLPTLPTTVGEAHATAWVMNRADGMIYHQAMTQAAARRGIAVVQFEKATVLERAARACGTSEHDLERRLTAFGTTHGRPWRRGQVIACAGAIVAYLSDAR